MPECAACDLCVDACPVEGRITMEPLAKATVDPRTVTMLGNYANWATRPNNAGAVNAAE